MSTQISEQLHNILRSKTGMSFEDIDTLTEKEGWALVYASRETPKPKSKTPQICFTGFELDDKAELAGIAAHQGFEVKNSVTVGLTCLVLGAEPGPSKIEKARSIKGCEIVSRSEFLKTYSSK
jgi:NAD-dependent DNA ligase